MNRILCAALLLTMLLSGADFTGKWTGQMPTRGETANVTFVLKTEGGTASGTMTGPQGEATLQDVKVEGDQISFSMTGGNAKVLFKGTLSGNELRMTRTREGGQTREFTLKRAQ